MIYSVHNPVKGGFDYLEARPDTPINDDLPTPQLSAQSSVGVAASTAGRPLPPGATRVGQGPLPVGSICSGKPGLWKGSQKGALTSGLSGWAVDAASNRFVVGGAVLLAAAIAALVFTRGET